MKFLHSSGPLVYKTTPIKIAGTHTKRHILIKFKKISMGIGRKTAPTWYLEGVSFLNTCDISCWPHFPRAKFEGPWKYSGNIFLY